MVEAGLGDLAQVVEVAVELVGQRARARASRTGSPACSQVRECHGPAQTTNRYVEIGGVVANVPDVVVALVVGAAVGRARSSPSGAATVSGIGALRSGWSKHAKTRWAMSMPTYAAT